MLIEDDWGRDHATPCSAYLLFLCEQSGQLLILTVFILCTVTIQSFSFTERMWLVLCTLNIADQNATKKQEVKLE